MTDICSHEDKFTLPQTINLTNKRNTQVLYFTSDTYVFNENSRAQLTDFLDIILTNQNPERGFNKC